MKFELELLPTIGFQEKYLTVQWVSKFTNVMETAPVVMIDGNLLPDVISFICDGERFLFSAHSLLFALENCTLSSLISKLTCSLL